jgi:hypothetical protein
MHRTGPFCIALVLVLLASGCQAPVRNDPSAPFTPAAVEASVRQFMAEVPQRVTSEGPAAWTHYFPANSEFFMVFDGALAYPDGTSAIEGITNSASQVRHIELKLGPELRVDVLGSDLAVVGTSWYEVRANADGSGAAGHGYLTAVVERHGTTWRFRDCHWSQPSQPLLPLLPSVP